MERYLEEIVQRAERNGDRYTAYLRRLKKKRKIPLEVLFKEAHSIAFNEIDCLDCGRCCSMLGPGIKNKDISRLARRERIKPAEFIRKYLKTDEDNDLIFKTMPCPFLGNDNYCFVYEDRPEACRDYPHMDSGRQSGRIILHINNLKYCPALVLAVEYLMKEYDY